jgi:oligopeptide/dipeptide ABC transporter ATP-binding protein
MVNTRKPIISVRNLKQYFPVRGKKGAFVKANDGISLDIFEGETFGLVGESGCGKSTLGRSLLQLYHPTEGTVTYYGREEAGIELTELPYSEMRKLRSDLQLIFQDPYSSLNPRMTVGQIIGEGLKTHGFFKANDDSQQNYIMKIMEDCGLSSYMIHRYPHQFSGGQRQRIGIARSLAVRPKFVVCDEAVSALDVSIQSQILNLLRDLKEREKLTYLFISHDLSVIKYISDRVGVMYLGSIAELAPSEKIFANPLHPYTEALLSAIPTTDAQTQKEPILLDGEIPSPVNPPSGCKFHTRCKYCMDKCRIETPEFLEVEEDHWVACHLR